MNTRFLPISARRSLRRFRVAPATCALPRANTCFAKAGRPTSFIWSVTAAIALEIHAPGRAPIIVATLGAGEVLDGSWLVPPYRWAFDARAVELTRLLGVNAKCLRDKCEADHDLGYELMKRFVGAMGEKLHAARLQALDVYGSQPA